MRFEDCYFAALVKYPSAQGRFDQYFVDRLVYLRDMLYLWGACASPNPESPAPFRSPTAFGDVLAFLRNSHAHSLASPARLTRVCLRMRRPMNYAGTGVVVRPKSPIKTARLMVEADFYGQPCTQARCA
jgi:hypothetical protein